jgi:hypothetical protein
MRARLERPSETPTGGPILAARLRGAAALNAETAEGDEADLRFSLRCQP